MGFSTCGLKNEAFLCAVKVRRCMVLDEFSLYWTCLRNFFDDHGMRHQNIRKRGPVARTKGT
jgi:hypothetical protein